MGAKELLQKLSIEDIVQLVESLDTNVVKENEEYVIFESICHGSNSHKLYLYKSSKTFFCYSRCGSMSLFDLIMKVKEISFKESVNYIYDTINARHRPRQLFKKFKATPLDDVEVEELPPVKKQFLYEIFSKEPIQEWLDEGISREVMEQFKIRYDKEKNRAIIPVFQSGKCIGIRTRNFNPIELSKGFKYIPLWHGDICYNFPSGCVLYGLDIAKDNIKKYKKILLVEGEKSVMKYATYYPNKLLAVAVYGSNISKFHKKMIIDLGVEEIVLAFDKEYDSYGDDEYIEYEKKLLKQFQGLEQRCRCSYIIDKNNLLDKKDAPLDKGKEVFEKLMRERVFINDKQDR